MTKRTPSFLVMGFDTARISLPRSGQSRRRVSHSACPCARLCLQASAGQAFLRTRPYALRR
eukprot:163206-Chlamydomonas_euryale.AAC.1